MNRFARSLFSGRMLATAECLPPAGSDPDDYKTISHTLPLHLLASYLTSELNCEVALLGIQPAQCRVGEPLSSEVQASAESVVKSICEILEVTERSL